MCLGIPGRIVKIDDATRKLATVDVGGYKRQDNIACNVSHEKPVSACVGDWVQVLVGCAVSRKHEQEAAASLSTGHFTPLTPPTQGTSKLPV